MTNRNIASSFKLLAELMELHDENPFKFKSYANAYLTLKKLETDLSVLDLQSLLAIPGIGKNIAEKIIEINTTGKMGALEDMKQKTPPGLIDILSIKGLGPKKVRTIWQELNVTQIAELLLACNENRLVEVKGFGLKTQDDIIKKIDFYYTNLGSYLYANVIDSAESLLKVLKVQYTGDRSAITGMLRQKDQIVNGIEIITTIEEPILTDLLKTDESNDLDGLHYNRIPVKAKFVAQHDFTKEYFKLSSPPQFYELFDLTIIPDFENEEAIFEHHNLAYVIPEFRIDERAYAMAKDNALPQFITEEDIRGVVHNHSKYSDGLNSISDMANECLKLNYEYFVISDHSRSAGYANGLSIEMVEQQWREIDSLNTTFSSFKVFKSIESDILADGSLDYPNDVLAGFDLVIASIHSNLKMDEDKAMARLIKAIENPYTDILGHLTGRLLLGREGYPVDHKKIIEACAANDVVIELNANPQRLDMDWKWIQYALDKNVMISINPDAHSIGQIQYIKYGINEARKAGLEPHMCLNAKSLDEFTKWTMRR